MNTFDPFVTFYHVTQHTAKPLANDTNTATDLPPEKHHTTTCLPHSSSLNCNSLYISKYSCSFPNQSCVSEVALKQNMILLF